MNVLKKKKKNKKIKKNQHPAIDKLVPTDKVRGKVVKFDTFA